MHARESRCENFCSLPVFSKRRQKRPLICTVDTDAVVIAISVLQWLSGSEIWIAFGSRKAFRYIEVHKIAAVLCPQKSVALPAFHALTGCNQVLSF